jgi:membrane protease YdiL (CAAX protease family)
LAKPDFQLLLAIIAPLLVWPWVPEWGQRPDIGWFKIIALFTLVPVAEEILVRGFIQGWLLRKSRFCQLAAGISRANWLTSIAFATAHLWQHAFMLVPGYLAVSLVFGHFRERYQGIAVPILLHAYYNLGLIIIAG